MFSKIRSFILLIILTSCDTGKLTVIADLPSDLNEVSGIEITKDFDITWMVNDGGNKPILYGVDHNGDIIKEIKINAKNRDWEDLTTDPQGNIYIGDFGNNDNDSKNLSILKISKDSLHANRASITPEIISYTYPEQLKFPPKRSKRHFDCESFIFFKDSLYLFTKSRSTVEKAKTNLYQLPAKKGHYKAKYIDSFNMCKEGDCAVTSADINDTNTKLALLTESHVFMFSEFKNTNFFDASVKQFSFEHSSQKESVCFVNDSTLYIADEYVGIHGGNLYEFKLK